MGKPLSRPGCFRKSSCCLEKHGFGADVGVGGRDVSVDGGYGDGYVPQRSIYDTMCINQQIDSHHHHHGGSMRCDAGSDSSFYSTSGSLRMSRAPGDLFDQQPRSLTPNPSFVRRLDERAIFDSLKLEGHDIDGMCPPAGDYRSVSPAVSSFSAPGISTSSSKKQQQQQQPHHYHHHHHHHGESTKSRDSRHSWKVVTPPTHVDCMELTTADMIDRGGAYLNPGQYPPSAGPNSSLTSPLISPFSGSPLSSGYHTPVFFSPAKPRPSQTQSLRCSPPQVMQPSRHFSQTQSLRMSPPHELRRADYRTQLVQLSAHDLEQDLRDRNGGGGGSGWGRNERDWEREREREMERGWAQREWERERERGRLERERARERERRENSFGSFGYGRPVPLRSERDSVFLEPDPMLDTTPLILPQPSPSPSPSGAPRMGTGAVGRSRAGSKDCHGGGMVLVDGKPSCLPRLVSEVSHCSDADMMSMQGRHRAESWSKHNNVSRSSFKNEVKMGSQVKTRPIGRDLEGKVQSGMQVERMSSVVHHRDSHRGKSVDMSPKVSKAESVVEYIQQETQKEMYIIEAASPVSSPVVEHENPVEIIKQVEDKMIEVESMNKAKIESDALIDATSQDTTKTEEPIILTAEPVPEVPEVNELEIKYDSQNDLAKDVVKVDSEKGIMDNKIPTQIPDNSGDKPDKKPDIDKIESKHVHKGSKSHKHKSSKSKSSSRSRPGTATGSRPGVLSRGLRGLESPTPPEGIESTWPRRIMVRKRTVRQGGALHNLPILPPLPSVLSALEKRRPHGQHHLTHSENPLSNITNSTGLVGRCSLKEPSHSETGQGISPIGRASLKEQNLESWRVMHEGYDLKKSKSRESVEKEPKKPKEQTTEDKSTDKPKQENKVIVEKENLDIHTEFITDIKQDVPEICTEIQHRSTPEIQVHMEKEADVGVTICQDFEGHDGTEFEEIVAKFSIEEPDVESVRYQHEGDSWDDVLGIVNTLWDEEGWEKRREVGAEEDGDGDSLSGSLQRWPLLRPPVGFGGSHPPSSAASELSLTELERRARELDSDLEHLDLSQPHRESEELYPPLHDSRERTDMYQTHPGPRDKTSAMTGVVGSRSHVNLELSSPSGDTDRPPSGVSPAKEDSSPDSNLTLESDSSGIFLSLSNQSHEEGGSDSDQPISGSDLGSSSTSLDKDGEDGLKEWGREESAELQWCYPSLLNTSMQDEDNNGNLQEEVKTGVNVPIITAPIDQNASEDQPPRRKVTVMGGESPLCRSPINQSTKHQIDQIKKPFRTSGLDCSDIDPFAQADSFVYLAVSARPSSHGEVMVKGSEFKKEMAPMQAEVTTQLSQSKALQEVKGMQLGVQKPEEGDFLCTDSFVYLAAPACFLLGPPGTAGYSGRDSDSESSDSCPVDVSVHGCGSVAEDSDWDSDLSDSDPSRPPRSSSGTKASGTSRSKRPPPEPQWDLYKDPPEPECIENLEGAPSSPNSCPSPTDTSPGSADSSAASKRVTWQFKPAQRSVCTGSRKEKDVTSSGSDRPPPSPSSSSSSPSSSSSG